MTPKFEDIPIVVVAIVLHHFGMVLDTDDNGKLIAREMDQ